MDWLEQFLAVYFGIYPQWKHWNKAFVIPAKICSSIKTEAGRILLTILRYIRKIKDLDLHR